MNDCFLLQFLLQSLKNNENNCTEMKNEECFLTPKYKRFERI